jgi:hypothetical protein
MGEAQMTMMDRDNLANLTFGGMRIIESLLLEEDGEPIIVRRRWVERLFSWPWRPFVATRTIIPRIPYRGAVRVNETTLAMHPATFRRLKDSLQ